jgi:hypothetical protein
MEMRNMNTKQLEMSLEAKALGRRPNGSRARRQRAQWWFDQMRVVVDAAFDWKSAPAAHEEKPLGMSLTARH